MNLIFPKYNEDALKSKLNTTRRCNAHAHTLSRCEYSKQGMAKNLLYSNSLVFLSNSMPSTCASRAEFCVCVANPIGYGIGICNKMLCHSHSLSLYMADSNLFLKCYRINIIPALFCVYVFYGCFFAICLPVSLSLSLSHSAAVSVVFPNTFIRRYFATIVSP